MGDRPGLALDVEQQRRRDVRPRRRRRSRRGCSPGARRTRRTAASAGRGNARAKNADVLAGAARDLEDEAARRQDVAQYLEDRARGCGRWRRRAGRRWNGLWGRRASSDQPLRQGGADAAPRTPRARRRRRRGRAARRSRAGRPSCGAARRGRAGAARSARPCCSSRRRCRRRPGRPRRRARRAGRRRTACRASAAGRSDSVGTCARGTTSTWPLNTGRASRNAATSSSRSTIDAGTSPAAIAQNTQPGAARGHRAGSPTRQRVLERGLGPRSGGRPSCLRNQVRCRRA